MGRGKRIRINVIRLEAAHAKGVLKESDDTKNGA
jgi:hypothetical protein